MRGPSERFSETLATQFHEQVIASIPSPERLTSHAFHQHHPRPHCRKLPLHQVGRNLFTLGPTTVRVLTPGVPEFPATVNPQTGGIQPFLVHCPELFHTSVPPLLPLQDGDVVQYEVGSDGVRITNIQKSGAENPPIPTSKSQILGSTPPVLPSSGPANGSFNGHPPLTTPSLPS